MSFPTTKVIIIKETKRTKVRMDRNVVIGHSNVIGHSMNARKYVHAQKPYPNQAFAHESSKVGERVKKRDRKDRG